MIDYHEFSPWAALFGGSLIGLSSALLLLFNGRLAGISGIFGQAVSFQNGLLWRCCFLAGLILGALGASQLGIVDDKVRAVASLPMALIAGIIVGVGTNLGSGCTSGHGICGMSRLSAVSYIAVAIFMVVGIATASLISILN